MNLLKLPNRTFLKVLRSIENFIILPGHLIASYVFSSALGTIGYFQDFPRFLILLIGSPFLFIFYVEGNLSHV